MKDLNEQNVDVQSRSMRNNSICPGIAETGNENCEDKFKGFIAYELDVRQTVEFHRVHREERRVHLSLRICTILGTRTGAEIGLFEIKRRTRQKL